MIIWLNGDDLTETKKKKSRKKTSHHIIIIIIIEINGLDIYVYVDPVCMHFVFLVLPLLLS